ncbi:MAG TPA: ABC transporter ATP-binding protein [Spirochaetia bacterium]|nr:ABC transporter ATP-binding protein [Spirochaetia bacterium]
MEPLLEVKGLAGGYGPMQVLWEVALTVGEGESVVLLGPNGAGKTTLLRTLVGLQPFREGTVVFRGTRIERLRTDQKIRLGISFMTEMGVFTNLSVEENLFLGGYHLQRASVRTRSEEFLRLFPDLSHHRRHSAGALSGGQRKMLGVAKALMADPRLLIMDEPSSGLSPRFVDEVIAMLVRFRSRGAGLFIAEQNVKFLDIADRVYVLDGGRISFGGTVEEVRANRAIREAYFGLKGH